MLGLDCLSRVLHCVHEILTLTGACLSFRRSYGAVYRAERRTDGMEVAVKIIPADNPADLLKEVDIMLACVSPYIVRLHDCYYKVRQTSDHVLDTGRRQSSPVQSSTWVGTMMAHYNVVKTATSYGATCPAQ